MAVGKAVAVAVVVAAGRALVLEGPHVTPVRAGGTTPPPGGVSPEPGLSPAVGALRSRVFKACSSGGSTLLGSMGRGRLRDMISKCGI